MKIRTLICVWLAGLLGLAMCGAGLPDIGLSSGQGRYAAGLRTGLHNNGGGLQPDTVRILSRDKYFPNTAAVDSGWITADATYDVINSGGDGRGIKYGYVVYSSGTPAFKDSVWYVSGKTDYEIRTRGGQSEDDVSAWPSLVFLGYVWASANGLEPGMKITEASLCVNVSTGNTVTVPANNYIAARLDTVSLDYRMTQSNVSTYQGAGADTARMALTWNKLSKPLDIDYTPAMSTRLDRHDWGPRSNNTIGAGTYTQGMGFRFDMTDAVQQVVDDAVRYPDKLTRGFLFMIYGSSSVADIRLSAGIAASVTSSGKGSPAFTATGVTPRGPRDWFGDGLPVTLVFDDNQDAHPGYLATMVAAGKKFTTAIYADGFIAQANADSLLSPNIANIEILHHSKSHPFVGPLTGQTLVDEIERNGWYGAPYWTTPVDTSTIRFYGFPQAVGTGQLYSFPALSQIVDFGYEAARAAVIKDASAIGDIRPLSWGNPCSIYAIATWPAWNIMENGGPTGTPADEAYIREELNDLIDTAYTDYGKAWILLYAHGTYDGPTTTNIPYLLDAVDEYNSVSYREFADVIGIRKAGLPFLDPGEITTANGYTAQQQTMAAKYDSAMTATGDQNYMQMWIGPK